MTRRGFLLSLFAAPLAALPMAREPETVTVTIRNRLASGRWYMQGERGPELVSGAIGQGGSINLRDLGKTRAIINDVVAQVRREILAKPVRA